MNTTVKEYRTHPLIYAIITIIVYLVLGIYGSMAFFVTVLINYSLKYRADKNSYNQEYIKAQVKRNLMNLGLIIVITSILHISL